MTIADTLKGAIEKALLNLGISGASFVLEHPTDLTHGDYATNVALASAKIVGKKPADLAQEIVHELTGMNVPEIANLEIAGPGFINITLTQDFFIESIKKILETGNDFGNLKTNKGKNILVEHSSPNLFKPFHIGHMMNNAIGESLVRLMRTSGANVTTMSFPSDMSIGIAKAIFILLEKYGEGFYPTDI